MNGTAALVTGFVSGMWLVVAVIAYKLGFEKGRIAAFKQRADEDTESARLLAAAIFDSGPPVEPVLRELPEYPEPKFHAPPAKGFH